MQCKKCGPGKCKCAPAKPGKEAPKPKENPFAKGKPAMPVKKPAPKKK